MTVKEKLVLVGIIALVAALLFVVTNYVQAKEAIAEAKATVAAQQKVIDQAQQQMKQLADQDAARQQQLATELAQTRQQFAAAQSPAQIATLVAQVMGLKQPVTMYAPPATAENPHPQPTIANVPVADADQIKQYVEQCEECKSKLTTATATQESLQSQLKLSGEALSAQANETAAWKKAAKGTFWTRTKAGAKYLAIGGVIVAASLCGSGHCKK